MVDAITTSTAALQQISKRMEKSAENVAKQTSAGNADASRPADPDQDLVDIKMASFEFEANLKVIKAQDKQDQALLDILA